MSTSQFCQLLAEARYGDVSPKEVDWIFHNETAKAFMTWLCSCIHPSANVLQPQELKAWAGMNKNDKLMVGLKLQQLDLIDLTDPKGEALEAAMRIEEDEKNSAESELALIREETLALKRETEGVQARLRVLEVQKEKLLGVESSLDDLRPIKHQDQTAVASISSRNSELNGAMDELCQAANTLLDIYDTVTSADTNKGVFVSEETLLDYCEAEQSLSEALREILSTQSASPYNVSREELAEELQRLRSLYDYSQQQYIDAHIEVVKQTARLSAARVQAMKDTSTLSSSASAEASMLERTRQMREALTRVRHSVKSHLTDMLPPLVQELGNLQVLPVLLADYQGKVARLQKRYKSMELVTGTLCHQQARYRVAIGTLTKEHSQNRKAHALLSAAAKEAHEYHQQHKQRLEMLRMLAVKGHVDMNIQSPFQHNTAHLGEDLSAVRKANAAFAHSCATIRSDIEKQVEMLIPTLPSETGNQSLYQDTNETEKILASLCNIIDDLMKDFLAKK